MINDQDLRDRALRNLFRALQEAGPELWHSWAARDPDLHGLRDHDAWQTLIRRLSRLRDKPSVPVSNRIAAEATRFGGIASDAEPHGIDVALAARRAEEAPDTIARPESPLRPAAFRKWGWLLVAIAFAGAALVVAFSLGLPWLLSTVATIPLLILAGGAGNRA